MGIIQHLMVPMVLRHDVNEDDQYRRLPDKVVVYDFLVYFVSPIATYQVLFLRETLHLHSLYMHLSKFDMVPPLTDPI